MVVADPVGGRGAAWRPSETNLCAHDRGAQACGRTEHQPPRTCERSAQPAPPCRYQQLAATTNLHVTTAGHHDLIARRCASRGLSSTSAQLSPTSTTRPPTRRDSQALRCVRSGDHARARSARCPDTGPRPGFVLQPPLGQSSFPVYLPAASTTQSRNQWQPRWHRSRCARGARGSRRRPRT